ncbi:MAG: hypothetical protein MJZ48_05075 [Paludibacteraceae bacterium]|nr:hypothetical protein [Paludibacteraceae bacterium]
MKVATNDALLLKVWMSPNAPVFIRHYKRGGRVALCRKPSCSVKEVEQFFLNDEVL